MPRQNLIKIRRGTEAQLGAIVLDIGELGFTTDTKKLFIGDGTTNCLLVNTSTSGDMQKSVYDTNNNGQVDWADKVDWSGVQNKPTSFTPATHTHDNIVVPDTRSVNSSPSDYNKKLQVQFKSSSAVGLSGGTYCAVMGLSGWSDDSGGSVFELGFQSDGKVFFRWGTRTGGWGVWNEMITKKTSLTWDNLAGV